MTLNVESQAAHAAEAGNPSCKDADMIVCVTTSFFAVEIVGFFALDDDPILG